MDADVQLTAATLKIPEQIPLENFSTHVKLNGGLLVLDPLNFGMAGGNLVSTITLDARSNPIAAKASIDLRRVRLGQLFPTIDTIKNTSTGSRRRADSACGPRQFDCRHDGHGRRHDELRNGRRASVRAWRVARESARRPIDTAALRRRPADSDSVRRGCLHGRRRLGDAGSVRVRHRRVEHQRLPARSNFGDEKFDITLDPQPKKAGILSLRGPVHIYGTFRDVNFGVSGQTVGRGLERGRTRPLESVAGLDSVDRNRPGTERRLSGCAGDGKRSRQAIGEKSRRRADCGRKGLLAGADCRYAKEAYRATGTDRRRAGEEVVRYAQWLRRFRALTSGI